MKTMSEDKRALRDITRRHFFQEVGFGVGSVALASLMNERLLAFTPEADQAVAAAAHTIGPQFAPKAKQVIYLFMAGAPSQVDLFDNKPMLRKYDGQEIPKGFIPGRRAIRVREGHARTCWARRSSSSSTASPAPRSRNCCHTCRSTRMRSPSSAR
jgi:hypothetical protein